MAKKKLYSTVKAVTRDGEKPARYHHPGQIRLSDQEVRYWTGVGIERQWQSAQRIEAGNLPFDKVTREMGTAYAWGVHILGACAEGAVCAYLEAPRPPMAELVGIFQGRGDVHGIEVKCMDLAVNSDIRFRVSERCLKAAGSRPFVFLEVDIQIPRFEIIGWTFTADIRRRSQIKQYKTDRPGRTDRATYYYIPRVALRPISTLSVWWSLARRAWNMDPILMTAQSETGAVGG